MRTFLSLVFLVSLISACKSVHESRRGSEPKLVEPITETVATEADLPACDDINSGRSYVVQSLNREVICADGGLWNPRAADPTEKAETTAGPRGLSK